LKPSAHFARHAYVFARTALAALLALAFSGSPAVAQTAEGSTSLHDLLEMEKQATDIWKAYFPNRDIARKAAISFHAHLLESNYEDGYLVMQLDARDMEKLRRFGFRFEPATAFIERRNRALTEFQIAAARRAAGQPEPSAIPGYACYETVEETFAAADGLIAARPTLASWVNAGSSWLKTQNAGGHDIKVLKLTHNAVAAPPEGKPKLFINSAIHAREYTTTPLVLEFARWLVNGHGTNADTTWILDHHEVHLMLHTNPDGRQRAETGLSWRKNANNNFCANTNTRGIDLNRNFGYSWNSTAGQGSSGSQCSLTYRGPSAASEPETQAVEGYLRSIFPDRRGPGANDAAPADTAGIHIDIHSYGQLVLWPWGNTATPAPNGAALQTLGRRFAWFSGYTPQQSIGLYPTDGTSDGPSYGDLGVAAFTFELGTAFFESCTSFEANVKPKNLPALIYAAKVVRAPYITPGGPEVLAPTLGGSASTTGVVAGTGVPLTASATDTRFHNTNGAEASQTVTAAEATIGTPPWEAGAVPVVLQPGDGSFNSATESLVGNLPTAGLAAGKHIVYVRARDASGTWGPVSAVFLNINAVPPLPLAETEPNDSRARPQVLGTLPVVVSGATVVSNPALRDDIDFFRIVLQPGRTLSASITPNPAAGHSLALLNFAGDTLVSSGLGLGQVNTVRWTNTTATVLPLTLRVLRNAGTQGPVSGSYNLQVADN
jgi:carboxypeptidase T